MVIADSPSGITAISDDIIARGASHSKDDASILRFLIEAANKEASSKSSKLLFLALSHAK